MEISKGEQGREEAKVGGIAVEVRPEFDGSSDDNPADQGDEAAVAGAGEHGMRLTIVVCMEEEVGQDALND